MNIAGIICEYNPFHNGHAAHIEKTRELLGMPVVCVMSGNFVQRGEPAVMRKHIRAEAAVRNGADLVLELPLPWAVSSAERFAYGGVSLLNMTRLPVTLSFGSECGDADKLERAAEAITSEEAETVLRESLERGKAYASARQEAADKILGESAEILKSPNNLLGIEYIKAIKKLRPDMKFLTFPRIGSGHDSDIPEGGIASASLLRSMLLKGEDVSDFIPDNVRELYSSELKKGAVSLSSCEDIIMYRLRTMNDEDYAALPDATEGLDLRLMKYGKTEASVSDVLEKTKTKRYAMSRIRRMVVAAAIGITADMTEGEIPYLRVLAFNDTGREVLKKMKKTASCPVITKPASAKRLSTERRRFFELEAAATDVYSLLYKNPADRQGGTEWTTGPVIV